MNKPKKIIDFEQVGIIMQDVQNVFTKHECNFDERRLVMQMLNDKLTLDLQKIYSEKMLNDMPMKSIFNSFVNKVGEDD